MSTYYDILGISPTASIDQIKKAYRKQSMENHPDRNRNDPSATSRFQEIAKAYDVLGDTNKRTNYDMSLGFRDKPQVSNDNLPNKDIYDMFAQAFRQHSGLHEEDIIVSKPAPIEISLEITLNQAYVGCTENITVKRWITDIDNMGQHNKREETETLYVSIPRGADNNEIITIEGKGHYPITGNNGDVKVFLKVINDTIFQRRGLDLILDQQITLRQALCGFTIDVNHVSGKSFKIHNSRGSVIAPSYKKNVPKLGMIRDNNVGNLIVEFRVHFPEKFSLEVVDKLEDIL